MKRILGPLLLVILVVGVAAGIFLSARQQLQARSVLTVRGLIGSEKEAFFQDPRVVEALRKNGLIVQIEKAGSRQIATSPNLKEYDFVFPSGVPAAEKIRREQGISAAYDVFFTPMVIASWKPIARILEANGVAKDQGGYDTLDMHAFLQIVAGSKRWKDLTDSAEYAVNKSILVQTTDVRTSNSAAMFLALASYIANGDNVVQDEASISQVLPLMEALFLKQGYTEYSSQIPFNDYLVMGMGKSPLVMIYEAQFLGEAALPNSGLNSEMVLLYPEPTIFSKHILIPLKPGGERLGEALLNDPELRHLATEFGFRNSDTAYFQNFVKKHSMSIPANLVNVVEPPSYEVLERMIQEIEKKYQ